MKTKVEQDYFMQINSEPPVTTKQALDKALKELDELQTIYQDMRENGDNDLRTVLMYLGNAREKIENIDY